MNRDRFQRIDELFRGALAVPAEERSTWLDEHCRGDADLRAEVEGLLAEDLGTHGPLDAPAFGERIDVDTVLTDASDRPTEGVGTRLGPYRLLELIGEGGFGLVYMAEQTEPVKRRVAIKILKLGMDTKQVIARFEAERQALAIMDHAHIAKVLDGGATESGRPYFVMELCNGAPITDYCDEHGLSIMDRLELFLQVCRAVAHSHQKGVIHRDIKPSNVLVATQDGGPFARVIDFGIAKAIDVRLTDRTMFTQHGQLIGTPEYMSPEQVEGTPDIDTRADVYSLGALLYELLTGSSPFDRQQLRSAAYAEIQRIIREVEPPHPSARLTPGDAAGARVAASRRTDPRQLGMLIRGELDWIVMKALEKDRGRRYQTASELAADIESHRDGRPVKAAPPSRVYRVRTFVRRNRSLVAATLTAAATLVLATLGTSGGLLWALNERDRANLATAAEAERAVELEQVAQFQASQLSDIDPQAMGERLRDAIAAAGGTGLEDINFTNVALESLRAEILERALTAIEEQFADQPVVRARLLQTVSETAMGLGLLDMAREPMDEALRLRRAELGDDHPDTLYSLGLSSDLRLEQGEYDEAERYGREAMDRHRRVLGDRHKDTLGAIMSYGRAVRAQGRLDEAYPYYKEVLDGLRATLGDDDPTTFIAMNNMGFLLRAMGRLEESEQFFHDTLEGRRRVLGATDPRTMNSMMNMAYVLRTSGRAEEAEVYYLDALAGHRAVHGDDHHVTLNSLNGVGVYYASIENYEKAEQYLVESYESKIRVLGPDHRDTLISGNNLGELYIKMDRLDEAESLLTDNLRRSRAVFGLENREPIRHAYGMALLYQARGDRDAAIALLEEILPVSQKVMGEDAGLTQMIERLLASILDC